MDYSCIFRTEVKIYKMCMCFWLKAKIFPSLKIIRECRNLVQLPRAPSHLLCKYSIFSRVSLVFYTFLEENRVREGQKNLSKIIKQANALLELIGKSSVSLKTCGWAFRPSWAWSSLCGEDALRCACSQDPVCTEDGSGRHLSGA